MGTNFYHLTNHCQCCGRHDERHIGKRSHRFTWRQYDGQNEPDILPIRNAEDWFTVLQVGVIQDQYGVEYSLAQFKDQLEGLEFYFKNREFS